MKEEEIKMKMSATTIQRFKNARLYLRNKTPKTQTERILKIGSFLATFYIFALFVGGVCYSAHLVNGETQSEQIAFIN